MLAWGKEGVLVPERASDGSVRREEQGRSGRCMVVSVRVLATPMPLFICKSPVW